MPKRITDYGRMIGSRWREQKDIFVSALSKFDFYVVYSGIRNYY